MGRVPSLDDVDLRGRRVLCRVDFNVPLDGGEVADARRIEAALPTVRHVLDGGGRLVLMSHLGRPGGKRVDALSLAPVARRLSELVGRRVELVEDCVGEAVVERTRQLADGDVLLLENLRFHAGETANDADFVRQLAASGEVYVNDAFGTAHRAHASTEGVARVLSPVAAGRLMQAEIDYLGRLEQHPEAPYVAVLGGAKVSDKVGFIGRLLERVDRLLIGGAMAYTFLAARGIPVGSSRVEKDRVDLAAKTLARAEEAGVELLLPRDHVVASSPEAAEEASTTDGESIPDGLMGLDIGPESIAAFCAALADARTVLWNGPLGLFEIEAFARGTRDVGAAIAASDATSVVGGGDTASAARKLGIAAGLSHISTGGGATLEFLSGDELPGLKALGYYD